MSGEVRKCKTCGDTNLSHLLTDIQTGDIECYTCLFTKDNKEKVEK